MEGEGDSLLLYNPSEEMTKVHCNQANGTQQVSREEDTGQSEAASMTGVSPVVFKVRCPESQFLITCISELIFHKTSFAYIFCLFTFHPQTHLLSSSPIPFSVCLYIKSKKFRVSKVKRK